MVQLFKRFLSFFTRKKEVELLSFNREKLLQNMSDYAVELHPLRRETSFILLKKAFETSRNIHILEFANQNGSRESKEHISYQRGRLDALNDVANFFSYAEKSELNKTLKSNIKKPKMTLLQKRGNSEAII